MNNTTSNSLPNALNAFTVVLLRHNESYLLLQRSLTKRLHPGLWAAIGGRVEREELDNLSSAAQRELAEETGIKAPQVNDFTLQRVLLHARPGGPLTVLLYFTGTVDDLLPLPSSPEGTLAWIQREQIMERPLIDNMRSMVPLLIADMDQPSSLNRIVHLGIARYKPNGEFDGLVWGC
ncbi:NUDIX domain-containing protein [Chloroflexi bacterium TSY]|nr:NUDIX domain-containing protein [Chloroflexi bacterium TSY]